jgi:hypothetical protein
MCVCTYAYINMQIYTNSYRIRIRSRIRIRIRIRDRIRNSLKSRIRIRDRIRKKSFRIHNTVYYCRCQAAEISAKYATCDVEKMASAVNVSHFFKIH